MQLLGWILLLGSTTHVAVLLIFMHAPRFLPEEVGYWVYVVTAVMVALSVVIMLIHLFVYVSLSRRRKWMWALLIPVGGPFTASIYLILEGRKTKPRTHSFTPP
jgi:hypothetical protein